MEPDAFPIKISTGCLDACTYCGVRLARGRLRSKPAQQIVEEFRDGLAKGYKEFTLIGTDLGAYGRDLDSDLVDLLDSIFEADGDYKLRLPNINPRWLIHMLPDLLELVQTEKLEVIGSAVQCGSNKILKLMNRRYKAEDYREAIVALKEACPSLQVRTNLIAGFPGETDQDFKKTLKLLNEMDITYADIHRYSPRPGTKAATMPHQVPVNVIEERYNKLEEFFRVKKIRIHKRNQNCFFPGEEVAKTIPGKNAADEGA